MRIRWILFFTLGATVWSAPTAWSQPAPVTLENRVRPVIAAIKSGEKSAGEAWKNGELDTELIVAALGSVELVNAGVALP